MVDEINKGDKPTDVMKTTILKVAKEIAEGHND
jgi:hypothetical protein